MLQLLSSDLRKPFSRNTACDPLGLRHALPKVDGIWVVSLGKALLNEPFDVQQCRRFQAVEFGEEVLAHGDVEGLGWLRREYLATDADTIERVEWSGDMSGQRYETRAGSAGKRT